MHGSAPSAQRAPVLAGKLYFILGTISVFAITQPLLSDQGLSFFNVYYALKMGGRVIANQQRALQPRLQRACEHSNLCQSRDTPCHAGPRGVTRHSRGPRKSASTTSASPGMTCPGRPVRAIVPRHSGLRLRRHFFCNSGLLTSVFKSISSGTNGFIRSFDRYLMSNYYVLCLALFYCYSNEKTFPLLW